MAVQAPSGIPEEHRVELYDGDGVYTRPRFRISYYEEARGDWCFVTARTRHAAVGKAALLERDDGLKWVKVKYEETY